MKLENDLGRDPVRSLVLRIAIPSLLAQFVSVLYSIVDRIYIGNIPEIGSLALAGAGVCGPAVTLIASFAFLVGIGGAPLVSMRMGGGRTEEARTILANCFMLLCAISLALTAGALAFRRPLLVLFGASPDTLPYAMDYFTIYVCGTLFALLSTGMNQFIICQGFAKKGMISVMLGAVLNIVLDPLFIFVLNMGVRGAAIATVISQFGSCLYVLCFLFSKVPPVRITFGGYQAKILGRVVLMGLAPFLMYAIDSVMIISLNAVLQSKGGAAGDQLVAAATICQSFMLVVTMPMGGITGGTQTGSRRRKNGSLPCASSIPAFCSSSLSSVPFPSPVSLLQMRRCPVWLCRLSVFLPWALSRWPSSLRWWMPLPVWAWYSTPCLSPSSARWSISSPCSPCPDFSE